MQQYAGDADVVPDLKSELRTQNLELGTLERLEPSLEPVKSRVAVLRVTPDRILSDIDRLVDLAGGVVGAGAPASTTILKDNISWHFPFPAANTTPWQLEGTIQALARRGFARPGLRPEQDGRDQRLQGRRPESLRADLQALRRCPSSTTSRTRT